eukprot:CAMPEP_0116873934 /NCGR_PEP_ID=MMETSP0463-20121206/5274_1 /TAXON_ID=181622 /ORGANISM="Strombidinopsis sp, Strain SopsisLIS2011" /LENGTH=77 /DNA_ID=CAMNT_0004516831 /DNA_START=82 /DNA_END=315 /DNA_ORIENTATION=-
MSKVVKRQREAYAVGLRKQKRDDKVRQKRARKAQSPSTSATVLSDITGSNNSGTTVVQGKKKETLTRVDLDDAIKFG